MRKHKLPKYVYMEPSRHGKSVFYFRIGKQKRIRMPSPEANNFLEIYNQALVGNITPAKPRASKRSLSWLIEQYRNSGDFLSYKIATRRQREIIFRQIDEKASKYDYEQITRRHIINERDERKDTPYQSGNYLKAVRGLFKWAFNSGLVETDPTNGVVKIKTPKTKGFIPWTEDELIAYRKRWPLGTRQRVWLEVVMGTGARRGDAVKAGRQHIRNGSFAIETEKQGVWAYPPVLPQLITAVEAGPVGDLTFIVGDRGLPLTKESFGNKFRAACNSAGVKKSAHGLRKLAVQQYAENGLSDAELETIFGWVSGSKMAALYRREADRKALAHSVTERMGNKISPHQILNAPHPVKKAN